MRHRPRAAAALGRPLLIDRVIARLKQTDEPDDAWLSELRELMTGTASEDATTQIPAIREIKTSPADTGEALAYFGGRMFGLKRDDALTRVNARGAD